MTNPLLVREKTPPFQGIKSSYILPAITSILASNNHSLKRLLQKNKVYTWRNLMVPFLEDEEHLGYVWSIVRHLHMVADSPTLRKIYAACLAKVTSYYSALGQNQKLYKAILFIKEDRNFTKLNAAERKIISNMLRDFHLSGADLSRQDRPKMRALHKKLSNLQVKFSNNVLDAMNAWQKVIKDKMELAGLPEHIVEAAKSNAKRQKIAGFLLTLHAPFYEAVLTYADNRNLRKEIYVAYVTRAPSNGTLIPKILKTRQDLASLLKFSNYTELSLETKMLKSSKEVLSFLNNLAVRSKSKAKKEFAELCKFTKEEFNLTKLCPWDIAYYSEKLRQSNYGLSQDTLRQYFPLDQVLKGMEDLIARLFGVKVSRARNVAVWHKDVECLNFVDSRNKCIGKLYIDLFARPSKQGGAWMDSCQARTRQKNGSLQIPIAYLVCNFAPPLEGKMPLLTYDEVNTLFHEFGHCLQHLLTSVDYAAVSGINGVLWDAVEIASQFMENWCEEKEVLNMLSKHYETGKPLPEILQNKMRKSKNMQSGLQMLRQLEFALFDVLLHNKTQGFGEREVQSLLNKVRAKVALLPQYKGNRFQNSFLHIFAGEYAAGYYSYKWSEVMSSDIFAIFKKQGLFNKKVCEKFLREFLAVGGVIDPLEAFKNFAGREPRIDALLKANEILVNSSLHKTPR